MHDQITDRELEILQLLADGLTDREIAEELILTVGTVKWYNRQIYGKLGVSNRTQAVTDARKLGLLGENLVALINQPHLKQQIHYTTSSDGLRLAYAISGEGLPLVKAAHYFNHLEHDWVSPVWRHWMTEFSTHYRYIRYDERGTGLSDWDVDDLSFDALVRDFEAVVDALKLERFAIIGSSQGAPVAIAYATRHPERVSHLVLYGSFAEGTLIRDASETQREAVDLGIDLIRHGWGRENPSFRRVFATNFIPEATVELLRAFEDIMQLSATAENVIKLTRTFSQINVRDLAMKINIPTLILHCRDDIAIPFQQGQLLASLIPNARLIALEGKNHIMMKDEPAWRQFLDVIHQFLAE